MIATAEAWDAEMSARIASHKAARDDRWHTVEAPLALTAAIAALTTPSYVIVDCLTLWLSNLMAGEHDIDAAFAALEAALAATSSEIWLVSNEVGWGIVPDNALARRFRDESGRLHQRLATLATTVTLLVAGLPMALKPATR
jgi:adenosylcobinamide kinase/adenosylcobinamide-phosphate guanylyltransferase